MVGDLSLIHISRADGGKVVSSAPTRTDTGGNIVEASELNLTWALLISGKGSQRLTQEKREVMMSLLGTRVFVKKGSGTSTTIEERNYPCLLYTSETVPPKNSLTLVSP